MVIFTSYEVNVVVNCIKQYFLSFPITVFELSFVWAFSNRKLMCLMFGTELETAQMHSVLLFMYCYIMPFKYHTFHFLKLTFKLKRLKKLIKDLIYFKQSYFFVLCLRAKENLKRKLIVCCLLFRGFCNKLFVCFFRGILIWGCIWEVRERPKTCH